MKALLAGMPCALPLPKCRARKAQLYELINILECIYEYRSFSTVILAPAQGEIKKEYSGK